MSETVVSAAETEIGGLPETLRASTLARVVLALAERLDGDVSDREAATVARELRLTLTELRRLAGLEPEGVIVDVGESTLGH